MKLQIQNMYGKVIKESNIKLSDSDILVVSYDEGKYSLADVEDLHYSLSKQMSNDNNNLMIIPNDIKLSVIKKSDNE